MDPTDLDPQHRMKYLPRRSSLYPAQEDTQQAKFIPRMNIVLLYVSQGKYKINKKSAGNGTKLKKRILEKTEIQNIDV
jgi:hypothetical protein